MIASQFDPEDLQTLEEILENEKRVHARKCSMCFALFASAVVVLIAAFIMVVITLAADLSGGGALGIEDIGEHAVLVQALGTLAGAVLLFFSIWCGAQNCLNTIERTLCAARNQRMKLFETFLSQIQCADKKKKEAWLEIVKGVVM